jgi:hypothetical protein
MTFPCNDVVSGAQIWRAPRILHRKVGASSREDEIAALQQMTEALFSLADTVF